MSEVAADPKVGSQGAGTRARHASWFDCVVWCWAFVMVSADIKVINGLYVHWAVTALAFGLGMPLLLRQRYKLRPPLVVGAAGLVFATLVAAIGSPEPIYGMEQAAKLLVVVVGGLALFTATPRFARVAFGAFVVSVFANAALLVAGYFGTSVAASEMAWGRWGTALNHPGSLWRCGSLVVVYGMAQIVEAQGRRLRAAVVLALGMSLMLADGSRTAWIALALAVIYVTVSIPQARAMAMKLSLPVFCGILFGLGIAAMGTLTSGNEHQTSGLARVEEFISQLSRGGLAAIGDIDSARTAMLATGVTAVAAHPLIGTGIGTTRSETEVGAMEVHMSYLQVWGDMGLLGVCSYLVLILGSLALAWRCRIRIHAVASPIDRALYYNAAFNLVCFALAGLFHPFSTEWSEWISYLVPVGMLSALDPRLRSAPS